MALLIAIAGIGIRTDNEKLLQEREAREFRKFTTFMRNVCANKIRNMKFIFCIKKQQRVTKSDQVAMRIQLP